MAPASNREEKSSGQACRNRSGSPTHTHARPVLLVSEYLADVTRTVQGTKRHGTFCARRSLHRGSDNGPQPGESPPRANDVASTSDRHGHVELGRTEVVVACAGKRVYSDDQATAATAHLESKFGAGPRFWIKPSRHIECSGPKRAHQQVLTKFCKRA